MSDMKQVLLHWSVMPTSYRGHDVYGRLQVDTRKPACHVFFDSYGKWKSTQLMDYPVSQHFDNKQSAMDATDVELIKLGYILLSKERSDKLMVLM